MQEELDASHPGQVQLLAVNQTGYEGGLATMSALGDLPVLQDTSDADMWNTWAVTYRDVVLLDEANRVVEVYNLTANDLQSPDKYAELLELIEAQLP